MWKCKQEDSKETMDRIYRLNGKEENGLGGRSLGDNVRRFVHWSISEKQPLEDKKWKQSLVKFKIKIVEETTAVDSIPTR